jgi:hypothetical protein
MDFKFKAIYERRATYPLNLLYSHFCRQDYVFLIIQSALSCYLVDYGVSPEISLLEASISFDDAKVVISLIQHILDKRSLGFELGEGSEELIEKTLNYFLNFKPNIYINVICKELAGLSSADYLKNEFSCVNSLDLTYPSARIGAYHHEYLYTTVEKREPSSSLSSYLFCQLPSSQEFDFDELNFSPFAQISFGHLHLWAWGLHHCLLRSYSSMSLWLSPYGYGLTLAKSLLRLYPKIISIYKCYDPSLSLRKLSKCLSSDNIRFANSIVDHLSLEKNITKRPLLIVHKSLSNKVFSCSGKKLLLHLRTSSFKLDNTPHNSLRNSDPKSIVSAFERCISPGLDVINLVSDDQDMLFSDVFSISNLNTSTTYGELKQWTELTEASYIIGCSSGMSHLASFSAAPVLYLNVHHAFVDLLINKSHIISLRDFSFRDGISLAMHMKNYNHLPYDILISVLLGVDVWSDLFPDHIVCNPLSSQQIVLDVDDFFEMSDGPTPWQFSIYLLFSTLSFPEPAIPNRNLTKRTYFNLMNFMCNLQTSVDLLSQS